jgi:hypothetical protein
MLDNMIDIKFGNLKMNLNLALIPSIQNIADENLKEKSKIFEF